MSKILHGLKDFFNEEKLSDRRIRIIEIEETFDVTGKKRSAPTNEQPHLEDSPSKKIRIDGEEQQQDERPQNKLVTPEEELPICSKKDNSCSLKSPVKQNTSGNNVESQLHPLPKGKMYVDLPVHSLVLCLNSLYFQKLFVDSGMKENSMSSIDIKVNQGEGKYLEMLVKAFYDQDTLVDISLPALLSVMDIAARFSCSSFVDFGLELLDKKTVKTLEECNTILQCVSRVFQSYDSNEKYKKTWDSCIKFLCEALFPLEFKFAQQEKFKNLDHRTVLSLLRSKHAFVLHENHLLVFAYQWLEGNPDYQTPQIIESFLKSIRSGSLSVTFLTDELTICDRILNKWPGYSQWFANTLKYHTLSHGSRELRGLKSPSISPSRGFVRPMNNSLYACKHYTYIAKDKQLVSATENRFLWNGVVLDPVIAIKDIDERSAYIRMRIVKYNGFQPVEPVQQFHQKIDFYFCLLPGFIQFKTSLLKHKKFIAKFVRKAEIEFRSANVSSMHAVAKVDQGFQKMLADHGLNLTLFFKKTSFSWMKIDTNYVKPSKKLILLTESKNYQQYVI
ncbi:uncharacterized protein [Clytia hemisphaerica]|uniref:BTB domain-containing protein n=1 Tax=Clytia hemisphaerica TaxID=252671 RepID=A0A7M5V6F0_9CNID